jgi:hypothetical protein
MTGVKRDVVVPAPGLIARTRNAGSEWAMNKEPMLRTGRVSEAQRAKPAFIALLGVVWVLGLVV